jgi:outer membrane protein assembly factor BamE (lipoprotein component of BamABCDE complex)
MFSVRTYRYRRTLLELTLFVALTLAALSLLSLVQAQTPATPAPQTEEPLMREYKGVRIGMPAEEARKKLGEPSETAGRQDFFVISNSESAQVFYDAQRKVLAVSVNYLGDISGAPSPEKVFGSPAEAKPDGSVYKMVRYQRAGYFVVYTRTSGDDPLVNVTMQKILD